MTKLKVKICPCQLEFKKYTKLFNKLHLVLKGFLLINFAVLKPTSRVNFRKFKASFETRSTRAEFLLNRIS